MCLVEEYLLGSQFSLGTQTSLARDKVVSKSLSLYSSLLTLQAQHASSEHNTLTLRNIQDDKPEEKEEQPLPSLFDSGIPQPPEVGTDIEIEP